MALRTARSGDLIFRGRSVLNQFSGKRCVCGALIIGVFLSAGCRQGDTVLNDSTVAYAEEESKVEWNETEGMQGSEIKETEKPVSETMEIPVNDSAEEVGYVSEDEIDPSRAIHRCVSLGEKVLLAYNEPDLYVMPIGEEKHSPSGIDNPGEMKVCNVAVDTYGRIHLLMAGSDYGEWYIWQLDEEYRVDRTIDVSEYFETKQIPLWFLIDKDGAYYFQWSRDRSGMIIDSEGKMKHKLTPQSLEISWIYEAAVGKDGEIYFAFCMEDDKIKIGRLDTENGSIDKNDLSEPLPENDTFSLMTAGTDTNLLLFSPYSGVWACDIEKGILENRVAISDMDYRKDTEYWTLTFLADGRLLLLGRSADEASGFIMKYIPAGR